MVNEHDVQTCGGPDGQFRRAPVWMFFGLFVIIQLFVLSRTEADPDLWGHIRFGQDMVASGRLIQADSYSFTSDRPWVNHEWLAEIFIATTYDWLGIWGLLLLSSGVAVISLWAVSSTLRMAGVREPVRLGLLTVAFFGISSQLTMFRPQLYSIALFALELWVLARSRSGAFNWLFALPLIFGLWANVHGGWIVGMATLWLWAALAVVRRVLPLDVAVATVLLAAGATLVNPYGFRLWEFLWQTVGFGRAEIADWQPLWHVPRHFVTWLVSAGVLVLAWRRQEFANVFTFVPPVVLGCLAVKVVRIEPYFVLSTVSMLAPCLAGFGPKRLPLSRQPTRTDITAVTLAFLVGIVTLGALAARNGRCLPLGPDVAPEPEAAQFLILNGLQGRLLTWFNYGEYAIWHFSPDLKVSYDGRRETVYSDVVQKAHLRFYFSRDDASYARAIGADYVWLPRGLPVVERLRLDGWTRVFTGATSVIFARHAGRFVQPSRFVGPRCFPGP